VALPDEYAEWAAGQRGRLGAMASLGGDEPFRILAPRDGDRYEVPVGVDARYATVALHAAGGAGPVRWFVDGRELPRERWRLEPGPHTIRAIAPSGASDEVRVVVEGR
jgi:membrane carboxypeptidase/penicillin-binding protein PbpC